MLNLPREKQAAKTAQSCKLFLPPKIPVNAKHQRDLMLKKSMQDPRMSGSQEAYMGHLGGLATGAAAYFALINGLW